jgi:hypothetical protein
MNFAYDGEVGLVREQQSRFHHTRIYQHVPLRIFIG